MQWIYLKQSIFVEPGAAPGGIYSSLEEALAVLEDRKQGEVALLIHITRHIKFCKQNTAILIVLREN